MSVSGPKNIADTLSLFLAPESVIFCQFLGPETDTFRLFLVHIVFSRILANRKRKKLFEQALDNKTGSQVTFNE
jgi:hypothetical protein